ncbi:hypothetical protein [Streptomyces sp. NPDC001781]
MAAEIVLPIVVRVGETEAQWGVITFPVGDGPLTEDTIRRETAAFFRAAVEQLERPAEHDEGVDDAAPR